MNLQEIKDAVNKGMIVHWKNDNYQVILGKAGYMIKCTPNNSCCCFLTWADNVTMNEKPEDFYINEL